MKALFTILLVCVLMSFLAILGVQAITIVPGPGAQRERTLITFAIGGFLFAWFCLAIWVRMRQREVLRSLPPRWLTRLLSTFGVLYSVAVFALAFG